MTRPRLAQGRAAWPERGLVGSARRRLRHGPGDPGLTSLLTSSTHELDVPTYVYLKGVSHSKTPSRYINKGGNRIAIIA